MVLFPEAWCRGRAGTSLKHKLSSRDWSVCVCATPDAMMQAASGAGRVALQSEEGEGKGSCF